MDLELNSTAEEKASHAQNLAAFAGLSLPHVRSEIAEALKHFGNFGILEEYTKHDISHIDAMLDMYDWLIPESTARLMTPADWLMITLATYLHDFGLIVTRDEFDARDKLASFKAFKKRLTEDSGATSQDYRAQLEGKTEEEADKFIYQEFARYYHAQRIRAWLMDPWDGTWGIDDRVAERLSKLFHGVEETFIDDLGKVCESHHLDDLNDTRKYPLNRPYGRTPSENVNVQYAAFLLRTSDLFHITNDRVPSMAAVVVNPRNPKSQVEWAKQSAVRNVRAVEPPKDPEGLQSRLPDTIEVHALFKDAEGYFGLTSYLAYAKSQLVQTHSWSRENQNAGISQFVFPWRDVDVSNIETKGFVTQPFHFSIDQGKILDLLTGHTLYNDTGVVVRELVQNSLDAVRLQQHVSKGTYKPQILVEWDSSERVLTVTDNGIGMTQTTIERNFLRAGSSRYQEEQFRRDYPDFSSISRFGIGVLSAFMVADDVSVWTSHSDEAEARQLSLRDVHGQYLVRLVSKTDHEVPAPIRKHGTSVRLNLRNSAKLADVTTILKNWIVIPGCEVSLVIDAGDPIQIGEGDTAAALRRTLLESEICRATDGGLIGSFGQPAEIRTERQEGLEISYAVQWNRWVEEWSFIRYEPNRDVERGRRPALFGTCVGGIRVTGTPPGFSYGGVAALANAHGKGAPLTNVARSSLEHTEEFEKLLRDVYSVYVRHIATEMDEFEKQRDASLTRSAAEASYLTQDLVRFNLESKEILTEVLRTIPAFVVEENGVRTRKSLVDLSNLSELATLESATIGSFEQVLTSIRGSSSPSLAKLVGALGSDEPLPPQPLLCGLRRGGLLTGMFNDEWEVVRLVSGSDSRRLEATWERIASEPRWRRVSSRPSLPQDALSRMEREAPFAGSSTDLSWVLFASPDQSVETFGFDQDLVICQERLLVLAESPFLAIQATSVDVTEASRLWSIAWLISLVCDVDRLSRKTGLRSTSPLRQDAKWTGRVLDHIREYGMLDILDEQSVRECLVTMDPEPLDVSRWNLRTARQE